MEKTDRGLMALLDRARSWPKSARDEAERALRKIEEDFIIGPSTTTQTDQ